jgi:hypothetical protein
MSTLSPTTEGSACRYASTHMTTAVQLGKRTAVTAVHSKYVVPLVLCTECLLLRGVLRPCGSTLVTARAKLLTPQGRSSTAGWACVHCVHAALPHLWCYAQ